MAGWCGSRAWNNNGSATLNKTGAGTLTLNGTNTYLSDILINAGGNFSFTNSVDAAQPQKFYLLQLP